MHFLFRASRSEVGEVLNYPSSVSPFLRPPQITENVFVSIWRYDMRMGLHLYYIHFRQYIHPIGSDQPLWAAGK